MISKPVYDKNFKNIFDMYPQGILDIIHQVISDNWSELIRENCPPEIREKFGRDILESDSIQISCGEDFRLHFKEKLPNELNLKNGMRFIADVPFDTDEGLILNLEFHSSKIDFEQRSKFNVYQAVLHNVHGKYVFTVVFSMDNDKHEIIHHKINQFDGFTMFIISLKALNKKQTLNNCSNKISNNIIMSDKEKALFLMCPAMDDGNRVETLKETIRLTQLIETIGIQEKRDMLMILFNFADEWFDGNDFNEIGGNEMVVELTESAKKRLEKMAIKSIKEEGRLEDRIDIISSILSKGLSFEEVSRLTGVSVDEISDIANGK